MERLTGPNGYSPAAASDAVDVVDVVRTLGRQWRAVLGCVLFGILAAAVIVAFAPRRFDGKVTVLARPSSSGGTSIAGRMTGVGDLLGTFGGLGLNGSLETELQVLKSRMIGGQVVDSLQLQFLVKDPARLPALAFVSASELTGVFPPRTYDFERRPDGTYAARSSDTTFVLTPGVPARIDVGSLTLRREGLPARFQLKVLDREDAITRFESHLSAAKAGGEIAKIVYRGDDSLSAAAGANAVVAFYLAQRKTTDRGVNQRRVEYVSAQLNQTADSLAAAEVALRRQQESSRIFDADIVGKVEWESSAQMRKTLTDLEVEEASIHQLLAQLDAGRISSTDLAAYPAFLRGSSVSPLAQQLSDMEGQRIRLLERRTESDPDVRALDETMSRVRANIASMARSYGSAISHQREQLQQRVDSTQRDLMALPQAAERGGRLVRDIKRLTEIFTALQAQLIEARLAAIGEGGDIRQIDVAVAPRKPSFPAPLMTMGIGTAAGAVMGLVAALLLGWFGRWLRDPVEIERAIGVSAQRFDADAPLLVAPRPAQTILVVPLAAQSETTAVAERIARTARQRYLNSTVLDLRGGAVAGNGQPALPSADVSEVIENLERQNGIAIVQLPGLLSDTTLAALRDTRPVVLVAPPGPVDRARLASAVETLRRLQVPCAGVVMSELNGRRAHVLTG